MDNFNTELTAGIDRLIWSNIEKSIEKNNKESVDAFKNFVQNIMHLSIQNKSLNHFKQYIFFPSLFYSISFEKVKHNATLTYLHKHCTEIALNVLKDVNWLHLGFAYKELKNIDDKKNFNDFIYWGLNGFNRLLYLTIKNKDYYHFDKALEKLELLSNNTNDQYYELRREKSFLEFNANENNTQRIEQINKEIIEEKKSDTYRLYLLLGIKYWILYLFNVNYYKKRDVLKFINRVSTPNVEAKEILKAIIFFRSNTSLGYFEWNSWDYIERKEWVTYSPPYPSDWMTMGFLIEQIITNKLYLNLNELTADEIKGVQFLYSDLEKYSEILIKDFPKWKDVLKVKDEDELRLKTGNILSLFAIVKRKSSQETENAIAVAPLSLEKISEFKKTIGNAWYAQTQIHKIFKSFGNAIDVTAEDVKLLHIGQRTFFDKAKTMFIDGQYHNIIYGIDRIGGEIGRWEDDTFFNSILKAKEIKKVSGIDMLELLDKSIRTLTNDGVESTLILMSPEYSYKDENLLKSSRFSISTNIIGVDDLPFRIIGSFDQIPIYTSFSNLLDNRVIVCDFKNAFLMRYKTNENWFNNEMTVDVNEVSNEEAKDKLLRYPQKWRVNEEGIHLTEEEAITLIKTSVIIDTWVTVDFQVSDKEKFVIGQLEKTNNEQ
jgi:hypothetical protein